MTTKGATPPWNPLERLRLASHGAYSPLVKKTTSVGRPSFRLLTSVDMMKPRVRFPAYHFQGKSDSPQIPPASGSFVGFLSLPWQGFIAPGIPNRLSFTRCFSIILTASWPSMRSASRRSPATSGRSSRRWSSAI